MSVLSPTALRFIASALEHGGEPRQKVAWHAWAGEPDQPLTAYVAQVALHALSGLALRLEDRIASDTIDAAEAAEMENDLGYIVGLEEVLLAYLNKPVPAYG
jgi:hypothetical protein